MGSLPLSGISLSILILVATLLLLPFLGVLSPSQYWLVGGMWLLLTVLFEFLFGHYVMGDPWAKLLEAYNILKGNLWLLVLLVTAAAPYLAARLRGFIYPVKNQLTHLWRASPPVLGVDDAQNATV